MIVVTYSLLSKFIVTTYGNMSARAADFPVNINTESLYEASKYYHGSKQASPYYHSISEEFYQSRQCAAGELYWGCPQQSLILSNERRRSERNRPQQSPQVCASVLDLEQYLTP